MVTVSSEKSFPSLAPLLAVLPISPTLYNLPTELCGLVLGHLEDLQDRVRFARVCKKFRSAAHLQAIFIGKEAELTSRVFSFAIRHNKPVNNQQLMPLVPKVTVLNLRGATLSPEQLESLVAIYPNLTIVNLQSCDINDEHIEKLATLSQLTELNISKNPKVTGAAFNFLPATITELNCSRSTISNEGVKNLSHLKKLECLELHGNEAISGETFDNLPSSLKTLVACSCSLNDDAVMKLTHLHNLEYLNMSCHPLLEGTTIDKLSPSLTYLDLSRCDLTNAAVVSLGKTLIHLKTLGLKGNHQLTIDVDEHLPSTSSL